MGEILFLFLFLPPQSPPPQLGQSELEGMVRVPEIRGGEQVRSGSVGKEKLFTEGRLENFHEY